MIKAVCHGCPTHEKKMDKLFGSGAAQRLIDPCHKCKKLDMVQRGIIGQIDHMPTNGHEGESFQISPSLYEMTRASTAHG